MGLADHQDVSPGCSPLLREEGGLRSRSICRVVCLLIALTIPAVARGDESRFGDSTWVAPYSMAQADSVPTDNGPRVAKPDHMSTGETILRFPFRAVFYPFRLLARGAESGIGLVGVHYDPQRTYR